MTRALGTLPPPESKQADGPLASCRGVSVAYGAGSARVTALDAVTMEVRHGEFLALIGASGSGKTTLLHVLGGLLAPTEGTTYWKGKPLSSLSSAARSRERAGGIAYVFQGSNLISHLSAWENLAFAAMVSTTADRARATPERALALVGLEHKADAMPSELSGGEQQRVAIARAVVQSPDLLLCDEPTGHLDSDTGVRVLDMLAGLRDEVGFGLVVATHDSDIAGRAARQLEMEEGHIVAGGEE